MARDTPRSSDVNAAKFSSLKSRASTLSGGISRRRRGAGVHAASHVADTDVSKKSDARAKTTNAESVPDPDGVQLQGKVAAFIETIEVQLAMVGLILFDLGSTVLKLLVQAHYEILRLELLAERTDTKASNKSKQLNVGATITTGSQPSAVVTVGLRLLDSLAGFTIVLFVVELAVLIAIFHRRFFSHFGYVVDLLVVGLSVALEIYSESSAARLLGVLRVWRVFRLVGTLVEQEQNDHEVTIDALDIEKTRVLQLQLENKAAEQSLKREFESRSGIERMLQGYKDEADTLREALTIAAQAVAEATMTSFSSTPEEDETAGEESGIRSEYGAEDSGEIFHHDTDSYSTVAIEDSVEAATNGSHRKNYLSSAFHTELVEEDSEFTDARDD